MSAPSQAVLGMEIIYFSEAGICSQSLLTHSFRALCHKLYTVFSNFAPHGFVANVFFVARIFFEKLLSTWMTPFRVFYVCALLCVYMDLFCPHLLNAQLLFLVQVCRFQQTPVSLP